MDIRLEERFRQIEREVQMRTDFNDLLVRTKPTRARQARWGFDSLNAENAELILLADQAFDPATLFPVPSGPPEIPWVPARPSITEPHRIQSHPPPIVIQRSKRGSPLTGRRHKKTEPIIQNVFVPVPTRRARRSASHIHKGSSLDPVDLDSTLDRFVDDIQKFPRR
jgi:hypothetical protein